MDESLLVNMVRIGKVNNVDSGAKKARVKFDNLDMISDWLPVLQRPLEAVYVTEAGEHTHDINDTYSGGGSASVEPDHTHEAHVTSWMPRINDTVLVLYIPVDDADGFILGVI